MTPVLAVDFDGTLVRQHHGRHFEPMPGAKATLDRLVRAGWKIIVHSARANFDGGREQIAQAMALFEMPYHEIVAKPQATVYLDNRGMHFTNWYTDYDAIVREGHKQ